ncbi:cytochrome c biogenesis protein ResB [Streptomyces sp. A7024]|uniref:Cytochrome c biogenesis protein ResB n=1 Tax=Streptomyces coryli TaxID=1128680 RepID=A0A6G4TW01_9ACTN|nr:cytochrome c biogenesis protein ResB [Streptomyces coryli]NGN63700.1 cytochrome c biogenesis protein ResB [Streptomyces coryli]
MSTTDQRGATTDSDLEAATSQLSTAPVDEDAAAPQGQAVAGSFGGVRRPGTAGAIAWTGREITGWVRWIWRQLTSMRVALILLFLLSLGSIPGSLIPQTSVDQIKVDRFREQHETLAPIYDKLQLFDVYSSVWFSAIYILLFISLAGCIVPRSWQFVGQLRAKPPKAPRRLDRLPAYTTWQTEKPADEVLEAAQRMMKKRRFRAYTSGGAVAAEKGYLREAGNLLFHIALFVLLIAFAVGQLWKADGGKLVMEGDGFSNTLTQYDDFRPGTFSGAEDLDPFGFTLNDFTAKFARSGPQKGSAREFRADVTWWKGADGKPQKSAIRSNHPLTVDDTKIYLMSHGYAPVVTVTDGKGETAYKGPVPFLPQDGNLTSSGAIKVTDAKDKNGKKDQLAFQGFFVPTYGGKGSGSMFSQFPEPDYPVLFLTAYHGDLGLDAGIPQNVYQLETKNMKQFKRKGGGPLAQMMLPGETMKLPNGAGSLKFEGYEQWASFQISQQKGNGWALGGAMAAIFGLAGSLFIQRRRVWVRASEDADGRTTVELAGLGRSESAKLPEELADLAVALHPAAPPVSEDQEEGARA